MSCQMGLRMIPDVGWKRANSSCSYVQEGHQTPGVTTMSDGAVVRLADIVVIYIIGRVPGGPSVQWPGQ